VLSSSRPGVDLSMLFPSETSQREYKALSMLFDEGKKCMEPHLKKSAKMRATAYLTGGGRKIRDVMER
jgi:hypothetical protein